MKEKGITLIELLIVIGLFGIMFGVMSGLMYNSDTFFNMGQDKISEQFEARKVLDLLTRDLRASAPDWDINGTHYPLAVSENFTRLDYYTPVFDTEDRLAGLRKVTYKLDSGDARRLLVKKGTEPETVVSACLSGLAFGAGCAGCASYDCLTPAADCPVINLSVRTEKKNRFDLSTKIVLRNRIPALVEEVEIESPEEGEF